LKNLLIGVLVVVLVATTVATIYSNRLIVD